ncbi:MAG: bifunctional acetate--CoA ligase family protein/GNAT family N-acetyltransferase [Armatimonadetes bacterium]|nr:bifunctional acetate--CoA ligase family protein/GNAT family N-acetyltransferase [Armatimonadota bacterium]
MSVRKLDRIFKPQRIAVIGASENRTSVGYTVLRNLIGSGFPGVVYPVNPKRESVQSIQAYPNVVSLPTTPDLAVICTPAPTVPGIVRECGEAGILGLVIISAGFGEAGPEGRDLQKRVQEEAQKFDGMRIIGPNCLGIIVPRLNLNASFADGMPKAGHVAFISQSGALCTSVLDWALERDIGFSCFISIGNVLDVGFADLIDYLAGDPETRAVILYVESITGAREFMSAARAFARTKPIVAYKAGRFAESARAAASHTGAMAGEDDVYEAAFQRAGIVRVFEIEEVFECAELLARQQPPKGARLAIITNAGGPGVMATDALIARNGVLAQLSEKTVQQLDESLPPCWSHGNPVDILGDAPPERFAHATQLVLADEGVDAVLAILTPQAMTDPTATARAVGEVASRSHKPILAAWTGGRAVHEGVQILNQAGIPTYPAPEQAVNAVTHLVSYAHNLEILYETPRDIPVSFALDRRKLRELFDTVLSEGHEVLSEPLSKALLEAYEIPVTRTLAAHSAQEAVEIARRTGYPVALKVLSPEITHKTDVGGVALNLRNDEDVRNAFERIITTAREKRPDARVERVTVQQMVTLPNSFEMIIGAKRDPTFGATIMVGMGGVAAEVYRDRSLGLPPLNERLARRTLESLRSWPLLQGYRGRPGINVDRLIEILIRFSYLVADYPEIRELDVNPLLVSPEQVIALDARIIIDQEALSRPIRPYEHLAIRPYPEEYVRQITLQDGTPVILRPIKPEDEPLWHELLARCSAESIRYRFRYAFKTTTHEMATRQCYIDYDREMAIVAEVGENGRRTLIGVGGLAADPDHETAEYALLVADLWQGRGLGGVVTDYCLEIARNWGVKRVVAETTPDNPRMIAVLRKWGFHLEPDVERGVVSADRQVV